ncbi:hypothetical protein BB560_006780 [Smittium megazygosporum]|uniref:Uncharacterized protein n=1 Tax=Smittium megazygosporum TaxID=133381 RepID=A0A2T9Y1R2_9FUNG|nr:hypothetical protein BB560_006780 [Smittium megazygosporum]
MVDLRFFTRQCFWKGERIKAFSSFCVFDLCIKPPLVNEKRQALNHNLDPKHIPNLLTVRWSKKSFFFIFIYEIIIDSLLYNNTIDTSNLSNKVSKSIKRTYLSSYFPAYQINHTYKFIKLNQTKLKMKALSTLSVLSFLAFGYSASISDQKLAKRQFVGSPCDEEGRTMCDRAYQQFYNQCVNGRWTQRDNPPGTKCIDDFANSRILFDFRDPEFL